MSIRGSCPRCCVGRAVSIRCGDAHADLGNVLREAGRAGATILVVSPGCWTWPGLAAGHGFQVVISTSDIVHNKPTNTVILEVCLAPEILAKVADRVESDPGIVLTVDAECGEVRARGELLARFETMAGRLLMAQRLLGSAGLPSDARIRLQRRLVAICDAMKAPGADDVRSARRLDLLLAELARAGQPVTRARRGA